MCFSFYFSGMPGNTIENLCSHIYGESYAQIGGFWMECRREEMNLDLVRRP